MKSICWLRRDLRLNDNAALFHACNNSNEVFIIFIFDLNILNKLEKNDRRVSFIENSIKDLQKKLSNLNSSIIVLYGYPVKLIPQIALELNVQSVYTNYDYEEYGKNRDKEIQNSLTSNSINFYSYKDQAIFDRNEILNLSSNIYKVFTPYKNAWLKKIDSLTNSNSLNNPIIDFNPDLTKLVNTNDIIHNNTRIDISKIGFNSQQLWLNSGEIGGNELLKSFIFNIDNYKETRDFPSIKNGTSHLSVHLRFGTISIRSLVRHSYKRNTIGSDTWLSELIWRDFYKMLLDKFPSTKENCFKKEFDNLQWENNFELWEAWCIGMTGYPIIDAAMRHFNKTGWMHNRLRMIVASFLTKDLLIDWKMGERYFAQHLLDFDLSANIGGWQWCASVGCDAQPYFRIFNPISQSIKFDTNGDFIRENCPELSGFSNDSIHFPFTSSISEQFSANCIIGKNYPSPIVDHSIQRIKALEMFKKCKENM